MSIQLNQTLRQPYPYKLDKVTDAKLAPEELSIWRKEFTAKGLLKVLSGPQRQNEEAKNNAQLRAAILRTKVAPDAKILQNFILEYKIGRDLTETEIESVKRYVERTAKKQSKFGEVVDSILLFIDQNITNRKFWRGVK